MEVHLIIDALYVISHVLYALILIWAIKIVSRKRQPSTLEEWYNSKFQEIVSNPLKQKGTTPETASDILRKAERLKALYDELSQF